MQITFRKINKQYKIRISYFPVRELPEWLLMAREKASLSLICREDDSIF